jgi:hypothetical protein
MRAMDIGRAINYNARQCLQARTGWFWQERKGRPDRGCSSGVEHNLAKVGVVGSNPIARSNSLLKLKSLPGRPDRYGFATPRRSSPGHHRGIESAVHVGYCDVVSRARIWRTERGQSMLSIQGSNRASWRAR